MVDFPVVVTDGSGYFWWVQTWAASETDALNLTGSPRYTALRAFSTFEDADEYIAKCTAEHKKANAK